MTKPLSSTFEDRCFLLLVVIVTLAFGWILHPFYGAVFWALVLAILFAPLYRRVLRRWPDKRTLASLVTLGVIVLVVILPLILITALLFQEGAQIYQKVQSGEISFSRYFEQIVAVLPDWVGRLLNQFGLGDISSLWAKISASLTEGAKFAATQAFTLGQNTFNVVVNFFIVLYLVFFMFRDGGELSRRIRDAIPLQLDYKRLLFAKFATVVRATVKGNVLVAIVQGALGGIAFWMLGIHAPVLWAVVMAFLSLLPAVGAALIWFPVAVYFLATGAIWPGVLLIAYGVLVIGLVDNVMRPILVGKDTKMPDYIVLISTLGGMAVFGLNGFVIGPMIAAMFMAVWTIFTAVRNGEDLPPLPPPKS